MKLRLGFVDTIEPIADFFIAILNQRFDIIRDDINPNYLIFGDENFGRNNLNYKNCIKIFYTGENRRPWNYECHYAISFDHYDTEKHFRLPQYVLADWHEIKNSIKKYECEDSSLANRKFCSFVVKNGSCQKRNDFFHLLNEYKRVDSGGPFMNNMNKIIGPTVQDKIDFMSQYKFNLAFENSSYPGYCTEKIFEAFQAKTMPIYWGSPTVGVDFDNDAILSWHEVLDDNKLMDLIIKHDQNDYMYMSRLSIVPYNKQKSRFFNYNLFLDWFQFNVYKE